MSQTNGFQAETVVIACLARNCETTVEKSLRNVLDLAGLFKKAYVNIYTNDNDDRTYDVLNEHRGSFHQLRRIDGVAAAYGMRLERMAFCRNIYVYDYKAIRAADPTVNLLISIDFDQYNGLASNSDPLLDCIATAPPDWGGIFPAHDVPYYDLWALRHETWCPGDIWREVDTYMKRYGWLKALGVPVRKWAMRKYIWKRKVMIPRETPPIEVLSAFGGLGIYRSEFLDKAWYRGLDAEGGEVIEHLHFNTQVRNAGGKLYILPNMVTCLSDSHRSEVWDTSDPTPWARRT